jgi:cell division protein FtsZ
MEINYRLTVIGIGTAGCMAVDEMIASKIEGVTLFGEITFICANTDIKDLQRANADIKIQLGEKLLKGKGTGAEPEKGKKAAMESEKQIRDALKDTEMLFLVAAMGGGTGTGASPVVAQIADDMNIFTIAVVQMPISWHIKKIQKTAYAGFQSLVQLTNSTITIFSDLFRISSPDTMGILETYKKAIMAVQKAVQGMTDMLLKEGVVCKDRPDFIQVFFQGLARVGFGEAELDNPEVAFHMALSDPLLVSSATEKAEENNICNNVSIMRVPGLFINITASCNFRISKYVQIADMIRAITNDEADVCFYHALDENMGNKVRVTVIATGIDVPDS